MPVEDEYLDVLQNIEAAIAGVYRHQRNLLDYDVDEAIDALVSNYRAEQQRRTPKPHRLTERPERVYEAVKEMCDWRLGHNHLPGQQEGDLPADLSLLTEQEILACLKRIKTSVRRWTKQGGRQGYLQFIAQFV